MSSQKDQKYFQFPLFLLRDFTKNPKKTLNNIAYYGFFNFVNKSKFQINDVAKQLIYCYLREKETIPNLVIQALEKYRQIGKIEIEDSNSGFSYDKFNPETEISQLIEIFKSDSDFEKKSIYFHKSRQAFELFHLSGDFNRYFDIGKKIHESIPEKEPMPMIGKKQLFEFMEKEKTEFEIMLFAVNIGIRSILGKKACTLTNKEMIISRAFGYKSPKYIPNEKPDLFEKYSKRYHIDKILQKIELGRWNLIFYGKNIAGLYVGYRDRITLKKMIEIAESNKEKNKINRLRAEKLNAENLVKNNCTASNTASNTASLTTKLQQLK